MAQSECFLCTKTCTSHAVSVKEDAHCEISFLTDSPIALPTIYGRKMCSSCKTKLFKATDTKRSMLRSVQALDAVEPPTPGKPPSKRSCASGGNFLPRTPPTKGSDIDTLEKGLSRVFITPKSKMSRAPDIESIEPVVRRPASDGNFLPRTPPTKGSDIDTLEKGLSRVSVTPKSKMSRAPDVERIEPVVHRPDSARPRCILPKATSGTPQHTATQHPPSQFSLLDIQQEGAKLERCKVLRDVSNNKLKTLNLYQDLYEEASHVAPSLLSVVCETACPQGVQQKDIPAISQMIGTMAHMRNNVCRAMQKQNTLLLARASAGQHLYDEMQKLHITQSAKTKVRILDQLREEYDEDIIEGLRRGREGYLVGDNIDLCITPRYERLDRSSQACHWYNTDFVFDRVNTSNLSDDGPLRQTDPLSAADFLLSDVEFQETLELYVVIVSKIAAEFFPCFGWLKDILPSHLCHRQSESMAKKSDVFMLPLLFKDEKKTGDCVDILDASTEWLMDWYGQARPDADDPVAQVSVPYIGDQLTRVRLEKAKKARLGDDLDAHRQFDIINPIIIAMWHTKQDFLEKFFKRFYNKSSSREEGTLSSLKVRLRRSGVTGDVKKDYESHEDFVLTVGTAALLQALMTFFGMDDTTSEPSQNYCPRDIDSLSKAEKEEVYNSMFTKFLKEYVVQSVEGNVSEHSVMEITVLSGDQNPNVDLIKEVVNTLDVKEATLNVGDSVYRVTVSTTTDDLRSYYINMLNWVLHLMAQKEIVKTGDGDKNVLQCKRFLPFFLSHSNLSKYAVECIDYVLKTNVLLSEKVSERVKYAFVVNTVGGKFTNKESDLMKENLNKLSKTLIRNLKANKSEAAIARVTGSAKGLSDIVQNVDSAIGIQRSTGFHSKASAHNDVLVALERMQKLKPFTFTPDRQLKNFAKFSPNPFSTVRGDYKSYIMSIVKRLAKGHTVEYEDPE